MENNFEREGFDNSLFMKEKRENSVREDRFSQNEQRRESSDSQPRARRSFNPNFNSENRVRTSGNNSNERGGYNRYDRDNSRPSFQRRDDDRRPSFGRRDDDRNSSYQRRDSDSPRPSFQRRDDDRRPSFQRRDDDRRPSFQRRDDDRRPSFQRSYDDNRSSYQRRDDDIRPSFQRRDDDRANSYPRRDDSRGSSYPRRDEGQRGGYERRESSYRSSYGSQNREPRSYDSRNDDQQRSYNSYNQQSDRQQSYSDGYQKREYNNSYKSDDYGSRPQKRPRINSAPSDRRGGKPIREKSKDKQPYFAEPLLTQELRLNRFIAMSGICSRRDADEIIAKGEITINGEVVTEMGSKVNPTDVVCYNNEVIKGERLVYIVMNKPRGVVTTLDDPHADMTVISLLNGKVSERVFPVGRLDKNSLGVILLTNDGSLAKELSHPSHDKKKIYHVFVDKDVTEDDMEKLAEGVELEDGISYADEVSYVKNNLQEIGLEIHSGKNRIVRRMFEHLGYKVSKLDRVYFAGLTKKNLKRGMWRYLNEKEVMALKGGCYQ